MSSSALALRTAIVGRLAGDADITTALGGARIYDDVPSRSEFPYLVFAQSTASDWSTGSDTGCEHTITLHAWSRARGRMEADVILAAVADALHDQPLVLDGHRLINLRHEFSDTRRDGDGETFHGIVRFRAVTEDD